jgi:Tfp pilus assembly protein FimV
MFEIENDDLSPEQRDALNAALAPLSEALKAMEAKKSEIVAQLDTMDSQFALKIKEVFDAAAAHLEEAGLSEDFGEIVSDELRDVAADTLYVWCSGRPLEYHIDSYGEVEFWEPSSC